MLKDPAKQKEHQKQPVKININHEPWNVYRILRTGQELKTKLTVDEISRFTDAFDRNGSPYYSVPSGMAVSVKENQPKKGQ